MSEITTTQSFSDGDTVTATKLNNIQANASIQPEAITNRTAETTVDQANDLLLMYDASATALKKVSPSNLIKAGTASDFPITGNATIGGTLGVAGNASLAGTLGVTGASTLTGNTSLGGTLGVTGNVSVNTNKFNVTAASGNTTIAGTLGVSGDATLSGNLSVTGNSVVKAGTAASPAIQPTGDTNTGIFFPAADTIAFSEGGTESMRIDSSGNVGIGTTSPAASLHVVRGASGAIRATGGSSDYTAVQIINTSGVETQLSANGNSAGEIRTVTNHPLAFLTNNSERLRIDSSGNVILTGNKSLISRGAGGVSTNSAIGDGALQANTTGYYNTANGFQALFSNTTGYYNTADGINALISNTTGYQNTANGVSALYSNTTGYSNTANGVSALFSNTTGYYNTADGINALISNTTGYSNTANGVNALFSNTTGYQNTANGVNALYSNTTGLNNTANGFQALFSNTTGYQNTANGVSALYSNTTGYSNTANGVSALFSNTTGNQNTSLGYQAGYGATGTSANTTGSNNTFIGNEAVGSSATASNVITLGNSAISTLRCQVTTITALSDRRDKKDIVPLDKGLGLINALNPVSFVWNMRDGKKVGIPEIGFIAQELEEAQKQSGLTVPNLVYADNPEKLEASPSTLIPILVKAVQELSQKVSQLEAKLKE